MGSRILIKNAYAITMDDTLGDLADVDILIDGGEILDIREGIEAEADEVIDAAGLVVTPGLIDTHRHMWQGVLRNADPDGDLDDYLEKILGGFSEGYRPQDVYAGNLLGALTALDAGVTSILDWSHISRSPDHSDEAIRALRDSGLRAVYAHGQNPSDVASRGHDTKVGHPVDIRRVRDEHFPSNDGRVTMAMAMRGPEFGSYETTRDDMRFARELDIPMTVHVGVTALGPMRKSVEWMHEEGLLGPDITFIHCTTCSDEALNLIAGHGATVSIASAIEMQMGHGVPPFDRLAAVGIRPSLSVDVETSAPGDMFAQMRSSHYISRMLANERRRNGEDVPLPSTREVLGWATVEGARTLGLGDRTGSLTVGKRADLVIFDLDRLNTFPVNDALGSIVLSADAGNVSWVLIDGRVVKRNGQLVDVDLAQVSRLVHESRDALYAQAGQVPNDPRLAASGRPA